MSVELTDLGAAGLQLSVSGAVATVTLTRRERRNAMTPSMWHGLAQIPGKLPGDVRVVVVTGEGPSFCAGIDLRMFTEEGVPGEDRGVGPASPDFDAQLAGYQAGFRWLRESAIVSIAKVRGHAIGAGFQLALACDLRVLADDAQLCMKEPALGLVPDLTGTKPLVDIVGLPRAIELCLTARTVDAREAERLGLAERVVAAEQLNTAVEELTEALLRTDVTAARATKALLVGAHERTLQQQAEEERKAQARLLQARQEQPQTDQGPDEL
jgi:enoyl-CoA hydratase/carnithine racemase